MAFSWGSPQLSMVPNMDIWFRFVTLTQRILSFGLAVISQIGSSISMTSLTIWTTKISFARVVISRKSFTAPIHTIPLAMLKKWRSEPLMPYNNANLCGLSLNTRTISIFRTELWSTRLSALLKKLPMTLWAGKMSVIFQFVHWQYVNNSILGYVLVLCGKDGK